MSFKAAFTMGGGVKKAKPKLGFGIAKHSKPTVPVAFAADSDEEDAGATSQEAAKPPADPEVRKVADKLAQFIAANGRSFEGITKERNPGNTPFRFLFDPECADYKYYEHKIAEFSAAAPGVHSSNSSVSPAAMPGALTNGSDYLGHDQGPDQGLVNPPLAPPDANWQQPLPPPLPPPMPPQYPPPEHSHQQPAWPPPPYLPPYEAQQQQQQWQPQQPRQNGWHIPAATGQESWQQDPHQQMQPQQQSSWPAQSVNAPGQGAWQGQPQPPDVQHHSHTSHCAGDQQSWPQHNQQLCQSASEYQHHDHQQQNQQQHHQQLQQQQSWQHGQHMQQHMHVPDQQRPQGQQQPYHSLPPYARAPQVPHSIPPPQPPPHPPPHLSSRGPLQLPLQMPPQLPEHPPPQQELQSRAQQQQSWPLPYTGAQPQSSPMLPPQHTPHQHSVLPPQQHVTPLPRQQQSAPPAQQLTAEQSQPAEPVQQATSMQSERPSQAVLDQMQPDQASGGESGVQSNAARADAEDDSVAAMEKFTRMAADRDAQRAAAQQQVENLNETTFDRRRKVAITKKDGSRGHHVNDYIPDDEMAKFMSKATDPQSKAAAAALEERARIQSDNVGHRLLSKMGWKEGQGLGVSNDGIAAPVAASGATNSSGVKLGLGTQEPGSVTEGDDSFEAYRKRMMLGYKHRPNPLGNPRKYYY